MIGAAFEIGAGYGVDANRSTVFEHDVVRPVPESFLDARRVRSVVENREHVDVRLRYVCGASDAAEEHEPLDAGEVADVDPLGEVLDGGLVRERRGGRTRTVIVEIIKRCFVVPVDRFRLGRFNPTRGSSVTRF